MSKTSISRCHLSYLITVEVRGAAKLKLKQPFIVRRGQVEREVEEMKTDERKISGCFCMSKGVSSLNCQWHREDYRI